MIIDCEEEFVTLNLATRNDVVLMSADEAEKCINGIKQYAGYIEYIEPKIRTISEIWDVKIGIHEQGIVLKFNKNTNKVRLPYNIALQLIKQMTAALSSFKRGFSLKFINKSE